MCYRWRVFSVRISRRHQSRAGAYRVILADLASRSCAVLSQRRVW